MSVLVNGTLAGYFQTFWGLRQGNPLFPLLFILVMEALSRLLSRVVQGGLLANFSVGDGVRVSHLLYALIFCGADSEQLGHLRCVLLYFEAVSGLKMNLTKSELIPVGEVGHLLTLAAILGCKVSHLPMSYLGLPLGAPYKAKGVWDGVLERVQHRLTGWKRQYLSEDGKLTLVKSILSSIPTYFMSVYVIPVSVARHLEKLLRDFLWGNYDGEFRYHLVSWKKICCPKEDRGLGVRRLCKFNLALLEKWLWRFSNE
ncbi:uncharacterized protein LOC114283208 [Camellia sinensis]|uniref:uncharacterized protein LOC114283208 n=1 Tax=Camellia sinensis TaxID=4442 RepID=UPI001035E7D7|nr:uncharacterized protein LOC114283208 [Camellia sinensis]